MDSAREVDRIEGAHNWSAETGLQPLNLVKRLDKVRLVALHEGLFRDGILTLEGAAHLVSMLSSGKSTLVLALLFTLARPESGYDGRGPIQYEAEGPRNFSNGARELRQPR
jgi:hypothetical protein